MWVRLPPCTPLRGRGHGDQADSKPAGQRSIRCFPATSGHAEQMECSSPCQGEDRGFESRRDRHFSGEGVTGCTPRSGRGGGGFESRSPDHFRPPIPIGRGTRLSSVTVRVRISRRPPLTALYPNGRGTWLRTMTVRVRIPGALPRGIAQTGQRARLGDERP
jgi:hypothetical protein